MEQTSKIKCPHCNTTQKEDIYDLSIDTEEMEGTFPHICDDCGKNFTIEYEYKPYIKTL